MHNIAILLDESIFIHHHGVRRYLFGLYMALLAVDTIPMSISLLMVDSNKELKTINPDKNDIVNNFFSANSLFGSTRQEILARLSDLKDRDLHNTHIKCSVERFPFNIGDVEFDLCLIGAPWIINDNMPMPRASRFACVAYDTIPNEYYFSKPRDEGLHNFAAMHKSGYDWIERNGVGLYCISDSTVEQCKKFGFGKNCALEAFPVIVPAGFRDIETDESSLPRKRSLVLAAPFDRRKGLSYMPKLINAGRFDSISIFGRARCSLEELRLFFETIEVEDVEWWMDVDFDRQVAMYRQAGLLLFPSVSEGLGLPLLEAYACGTSALVTNIDPLNKLAVSKDVLSDTETEGLLQISARMDSIINPIDYTREIQRMLSDERRELGKWISRIIL